jgi:GNAT superfamily N-acetyltransferase
MDIRIRPLEERELPEADRIMRLAFGTFMGLPDPTKTFGDSDYAYTRFHAAPDSALAAEADGKLVGTNFVTRWGSFGFFGPLSVEPRLWEHKVAQRLLGATMNLFKKWGCRHTGLFTFSHSPKHAGLYQKFDYWPRFLTPVMSKEVAQGTAAQAYSRFSTLSADQKREMLAECGALTGEIFDGLEVSREISAVDEQHLGDALFLLDGSRVSAFAVCHVGPRTEAGSDLCYVKFAAVRPGPGAQVNFGRLLDACESFTASQGISRLSAGVNMGRHEAYQTMVQRRYRTDMQGVAMQSGDDAAFNRPGVYVLDDWR